MIVSHSREFVFVHTTKTAGEAITAALAHHLDSSDLVLTNGPQAELRRRLLPRYRAVSHLRKHSTAGEIRDAIGEEPWGRYLSFAVVRDPVQRVASLYRYLQKTRARVDASPLRRAWYRSPLGTRADPRAWPGMQALNETADFSEFIRHPAVVSARGLRPQVDMVTDAHGDLIVSTLIHLEDLDAGLAAVWRQLDLRWEGGIAARNVSSSFVPANGVSRADRDLLADRYSVDYETLGYEA